MIVDVHESPDGAEERITRCERSRSVTEARPPTKFRDAVA